MRTALLMVLGLSSLACQETLPPLENPGVIFKTTITADYKLNLQENSVHVFVDIKSNYDETVQERADVVGSVTITSLRDARFTRTILLGAADLRTAGKYNPSTGMLTVGPGDVLRFEVVWDLRDDNGVYVPAALFRYFEDPDCPVRCVAEEEVFVMRGGVKLCDQVARIDAEEFDFSICHIKAFVDGCTAVVTGIPCSKRPPAVFPKPCL